MLTEPTLGGLSADALDLRCPLLPQTLAEALELSADPDLADVDRVTAMVERDQVLLAQMLKSVNSAYYGVGRTITSPARAVVLLGPTTVVGLVAAMNVSRMRPQAAPEAGDRLVRHSLATAYLAQFLVEQIPPSERVAQTGEAYTAGLLHDFGKLVLLHNFPAGAAPLYAEAAAGPVDGPARERALFGCDHTEAGAVAAYRSKFPEALVEVIRHHHNPNARVGRGVGREGGFLLRIAAAASRGAALHGFGAGPEAEDADAPLATLAALDLPAAGSAAGVAALIAAEAPRLQLYVDSLLAAVPDA